MILKADQQVADQHNSCLCTEDASQRVDAVTHVLEGLQHVQPPRPGGFRSKSVEYAVRISRCGSYKSYANEGSKSIIQSLIQFMS